MRLSIVRFIALALVSLLSSAAAFTHSTNPRVQCDRSRASTALSNLKIIHHEHAVRPTFAGRIWPALLKFKIGPAKAKEIVRNVLIVTDWQDIVLLLLVAYGTSPLANRFAHDEDTEETQVSKSFFHLRRKSMSKLISSGAKVAMSVYAVDVICIVLRTLGFTFPARWDIPAVYSKTAYSFWGIRRFLEFKRAALCRIYKVQQEKMGRVEILDRLLNGITVSLACLLLFDWLSVRMGMALKGLVAFGSVGTLAFTLASQDLVSQFISGIFLSASNKVYVGDSVLFGDGTSGSVLSMGWMETTLRGGDNTITSIPNSKLADQKISNLSRVQVSQVKQILRFHYEDADEIPELLGSIRDEIKASCPMLVTDGSRPFRVFWTSFNEDHLEVMVDAHFYIPPLGDAYYINRQKVLMAINRAVKNHNLELAKLYRNEAAGQEPLWRVVPKPPPMDRIDGVEEASPGVAGPTTNHTNTGSSGSLSA